MELIPGVPKIPCYILEDGTRVLSGRGMQEALNLVDEAVPPSGQKPGTRLTRYLEQKTLKPYIYKGKNLDHFAPIECHKGATKINGYEATVLVDVCDGFLEARKHIALSPRQKIIATQCEILVRAFAKVGIIALVDEATGYQDQRPKEALQQILKMYVAEDILEWQLTFTVPFYKEVYRLWNRPWTENSIKKKPQFIGKVTNRFIYEKMPPGVMVRIREKTSKTKGGHWKYKFHQSLTPEIGREHLKRQIIEVRTLMSISDTKAEFKKLFEKKYGQLEIPFTDLDLTIETETAESKNGFDNVLKGLLKVPPEKKE